jgi:uncharacterized membrane protein YedE/YeeE
MKISISPESSLSGPLAGGLLIGLSTSALLLATARITGLSGIVEEAVILKSAKGDKWMWAWVYAGGLLVSGTIIQSASPTMFGSPTASGFVLKPHILILSGFLTGFGTRMGCGCTSGHGIGGLPRLSPRSLAAVLTFMSTGAIAASISRSSSFSSHFYEPWTPMKHGPPVSNQGLYYFLPSLLVAAAASCTSGLVNGISGVRFPHIGDSILSLVCALIFGAGLGIGGMLEKNKVIGFLDFGGRSGWDYSLMGVMGSGVLFNLMTFHLMRSWDLKSLLPASMPKGTSLRTFVKYALDPANLKIDSTLICGAGLFGLGWGVSGFCPGPAIVSLGGRVSEAGVYVPAMLAGILIQDLWANKASLPNLNEEAVKKQ